MQAANEELVERESNSGGNVTILQSNTDALLVAIPMVGLLFAGFFRLDELFGKSKKPVQTRRSMNGWDKNGRPVCADPDGKMPLEASKRG